MAGGTRRVVGEYEFGERLGSGSFSVVWKARRRGGGADDDDVAVKEIALDNMSKKLRDGLLSEIAILRTIRHPNIIALHNTFEAPCFSNNKVPTTLVFPVECWIRSMMDFYGPC